LQHSGPDRHSHAYADVDLHALANRHALCADRHAHACADVDLNGLADRDTNIRPDFDAQACADVNALACPDLDAQSCSDRDTNNGADTRSNSSAHCIANAEVCSPVDLAASALLACVDARRGALRVLMFASKANASISLHFYACRCSISVVCQATFGS
jgi:hypothetical protein